MVSTASRKAKALQASLSSKNKHKKRITAFMAAAAAAVMVSTNHIISLLFPTPMNTSVLTGMGWLQEFLTGHAVHFYDSLGMPKHVFRKLVQELNCMLV